jgi:cobalt-zinc-cadmium efflux system protein
MAHAHAHGEDCIHGAALDAVRAGNPDVRRRLTWALALTLFFMVAEVVGGLVANSLALLADAGHMLTDAGALALALAVATWTARVARRTASESADARSAGGPVATVRQLDAEMRRRLDLATERREAWAALVNGGVLLVVCAAIVAEAIGRLRTPEPVETGLMLVVAVLGLAVNIGAALMLRPVVGENLNARGAYVHVLGDLLGSVGTIVAALIIRQSGYLMADPIASLVVSALVLRAATLLVLDALSIVRRRM